MKVSFYTLGCKLNQAEVESLGLDFIQRGWQIVKKGANVCIVNCCSVTAKAEKESRQTLRLTRRQNPRAKLIAIGCFREKDVQEVDRWIPRSNLLRGPTSFKVRPSRIAVKGRVKKGRTFQKIKTRSFIKIQDGCDNFCSFCIVPYFRGKPKSRSAREISREIKEREKIGYQEIVLVGVNIGKWGIEMKASYKYCDRKNRKTVENGDLVWLVKKILKETSIPRVRLSSLWPTAVTDDLIALFKNKRLCPHVHLSLQSGSDKILKKMGRNYTTGQVENIIKKLRKKVPEITLTADVIVGFPGETENDFKKTCDFVKQVGFLKLHVFRYSVRSGTKAAGLVGQVPFKVRQKRSKILRQLSDKMSREVRKKFAGQTRPVLFEERTGDFWQGFTDNYIRVYLKSSENLKNKIIEVKL